MNLLTLISLLISIYPFATAYDPYPEICGSYNDYYEEIRKNSKFSYGPGNTQTYKYTVDVKTFFNGTSNNESTLHIESLAHFSFISATDGILTLSEVILSENTSPNDLSASISDAFSDKVTQNDLRFAFKDGAVTELCPQLEEDVWILNFKRGILSMIHNTMRRIDLDHTQIEEDVKGICSTNYKVIGVNKTSLLIEKTKNIASCSDRVKLYSVIQSSKMFDLPLGSHEVIWHSDSKCDISIDHNIYSTINCNENYLLKPFSNGQAGAATTVNQKLELVAENKSEKKLEKREVHKRSSLVFDYTLPDKSTEENVKVARSLIKKMCWETRDGAPISISELISTTIRSFRELSYRALTAFYRHSERMCSTGKKHFLNILPYISTGASITVMKDVILKENIEGELLEDWMLSIAFIPQPEHSMIEAVAKILEYKKFTSNIALSISSVVHTYCKNNDSCSNNEHVQFIVSKFQDFIKEYVNNDSSNAVHHEVLVAFKSLGTIGILYDNFRDDLENIILNENLGLDIRISAIESFRRLPCEQEQPFFVNLFRNDSQGVEIRIASYLQLMRCPNYLLIRTIEHCLKEEEVNQVGSFVWTHLTNLIESSNPSRVVIQSLLSEKNLQQKFSSDFRKFSHNREGAVYFDEYNVGGSYDSNVIFSTSSYIPRSAMVNFTLDLFGQSINMLELYGRAEGLEYYLESVFGPRGKYKGFKSNFRKFFNKRDKRDTNSINELTSNVEKLPNLSEFADEPKVTLGLKIFGNDIKFNSWNGDTEIKNTLNKFNPIEHIRMLLSGQQLQYNKTALILDSKLVVPTGAGLPLSLSVFGSSSVLVKFYGSLQTKELSQKGKLEIAANIEPMVSIDISAEMGVDAYFLSSGIKLNSKIGTSSAIQSEIKIHGTKLVSIKFSLPKETNKLFEAKTTLLVKQQHVDVEQSGLKINRNEYSICSLPVVEKTIGLIQCAEYSYVNTSSTNFAPKFLLAGPARIHWSLNKTDPTARTYIFEYKSAQRQGLTEISVTFDTPGSKINRLLNANVTIDKNTQNLTMLLESAAGTVLATGKYKDTDFEKSLQFSLSINNKKHFDTSIILERKKKTNGYTYLPKMYLEINGDRVFNLNGTVDLISKNDISQYTVNIKFRTKRLDSRLYGYISKTQTSVGADLHLDYTFINTSKQRTSFKLTIGNKSKKNKVHIITTCNLSSTAYPHYSFNSSGTFQQIGSHMEFKANLNQDSLEELDDKFKGKALSIELEFSSKEAQDGSHIVKMISGVKRQASNLDLQTDLEYKSSISDADCKFTVKYGDNKEVIVSAFYSHPRTTLMQVMAKLNVTIPSFNPMIFDVKVKEIGGSVSNDYKFDVKAMWFSGVSFDATGVYQDKSTAIASNHHLKSFIKSPNFKDITVNLQIYRDSGLIDLNLEGDYDDQHYKFSLKHDYGEPVQVKTNVEVKLMNKVYNMNSLIYNGDYIKASVEFHFDRMRDIDLSLLIYNHEDHKAFNIDLNWDANRDPNQKLLVAANYTKIADFNSKSDLIISYPGRTILGKYEIRIIGGRLDTLASVSWDDEKTLGLILNIMYDFENKFFLEVYSRLNTPIENWKTLNILTRIEHEHETYRVHGEFSRGPKRRATFDFFGNYVYNGYGFKCRYSASIYSSLDRIPNINATVSHSQNKTHFDTKLYVMRNPEFVIDIDSRWKVEKSNNVTNITGNVHSYTPFKGFNKGFFIAKIDVTNDKYVKGVGTLDMNHKRMLLNVEGKLKRLMDSLLVLNATTIDENYQLLFTLSRENRHFATIISYPSGNLGTEVILQGNSITNFNVKLYLATPIEILQRVLIVAKLQPLEADFRVGYNKMLFGGTGVWRFNSLIDFEHSYKIFTPLKSFEETGIVAKLVFDKGIDLQMAIKAYKYKLGVTFFGKPNSRTLKELGTDINKIYGIEKSGNLNTEGWEGSIEIDAVIYPTIKGTLEIYQEGTLYILLSKLNLPQGEARISEEFEFIDILNMKNLLTISTPYDNLKSIESKFQLGIKKDANYLLEITLNREHRTGFVKSGIFAYYSVNRKSDVDKTYNVTINIVTPLEKIKKLDLSSLLQTEDKFSYLELYASKDASSGSIELTSQLENNNISLITSNFEIHTPALDISNGNIKVRKLFSSNNNFVEINLNMPENLKYPIFANATWLIKSLYNFKAFTELKTPFPGIEHTIVGVDLTIAKPNSSLSTTVKMHPLNIEINSTYIDNLLDAKANLEFSDKNFPITLKCKTTRIGNKRIFDGDLYIKSQPYKVNGNATIIAQIPANVYILISPQNRSDFISFEYDLKNNLRGYEISGAFQRLGSVTVFKGDGTLKDKFNWNANIEIIPGSIENEKMSVHAVMESSGNEINLDLSAHTNIDKLLNPKLSLDYVKEGLKTNIYGKYELSKVGGRANISYIWIFLDNMYIDFDGFFRNEEYDSHSKILAFYKNPGRQFKLLSGGSDIQIDKIWQATVNATATLPNKNDIGFDAHFKWPSYSDTLKSLSTKLKYGNNIEFIHYVIKYINSTVPYGSKGDILIPNLNNMDANIDVEWNDTFYKNLANYKKLNKSIDAWYRIKSQKQGVVHEAFTDLFYRDFNNRVNLTYRAFYPTNKPVLYATVDYLELGNMFGNVNLTFPYKFLNSSALKFTTRTSKTEYYRFAKVFWTNESMFIEAKANNSENNSLKNSKGQITVEIPLTTRHKAFVEYEYSRSPENTDGLCNVRYNGNEIAQGKFKSISENTTEFHVKTMEAQLQNSYAPIGAKFISKYSLSPSEKIQTPYLDTKYVHLFNLQNRSKFNVSGELISVTNQNGQEYKLQAVHLNRTILLSSKYVSEDKKYKQFSRLELSPTTWLECNLKFVNKTTNDVYDVQDVVVDLFYPRRNFTGQLSYNLSDEITYLDALLVWDTDKKSAQGVLDWKKLTSQSDLLEFHLKHPSFVRDVTFSNVYGYDNTSIYSNLTVDYSMEPEERFVFSTKLEDNCDSNTYNYTYNIFAEHPYTTLYLDSKGSLYCNSKKCGTIHTTDYRRSIVPLTKTEYVARINDNELELKKNNSDRIIYFFGTYDANFPVYTAEVNMLNGTNENYYIGHFIADLKSKILSVNFTSTIDELRGIYEVYRVFGVIPDSRSATFDMWRNYEDTNVSDVHFYLRLNHSRFITSKVLWRPELMNEFQKSLLAKIAKIHQDFLDNVNVTRQYIRAEIMNAISDTWENAKPSVQLLLDDLKNLSVVLDDVAVLKQFLNQSYYTNEFYIKDIYEAVAVLFDELSLKTHLQKLPKIFQEVWEIMGESGEKLKKNIIWVTDQIKTAYNNLMEFVNQLVNGDPVEQVSKLLGKLIEKYDDFIKNMHVSFLKYMETLWNQTYNLMVEQWYQTLAEFEPSFLKLIHYLETIVYNTAKDFLDFLYVRKHKITESAFFMEFAKFSKDVDKFYRDITGNNTLGAIAKYSEVTWNFIHEKYIRHIPFGKEVQDVFMEILGEIKQLEQIPSVKAILNTFKEMFDYVKYYYEKLEIQRNVENLVRIIYLKIYNSETALEMENRKREAKTKFIFEPEDGYLLLEQKLPMSWHAFNETPKIQEIPEIKWFYDVYSFVSSAKFSFWDYYYDYIPYLESDQWLPPFKTHAMMVGSKFFVTFDKKYYNFKAQCTYLLATDSINRNFTVLLETNKNASERKLLILLKNNLVTINLINQSVELNNNEVLPVEIEGTYIFKEAGILKVVSDLGFNLECNSKFEICIFEMSGWYFGKTSGLWGTYNNEYSDDFKVKTINNFEHFVNSWSVDKSCVEDNILETEKNVSDYTIQKICKEFFVSGISQLSTCFSKIAVDSFLELCLQSQNEKEACSSAIAYVELCSKINVPLRIPDNCVTCRLLNGSHVPEGKIIHQLATDYPKTADIVFVLEAKICNKDVITNKNIETLIESIQREFQASNFTNNRYSLVVFGGNGVYNKPRSVSLNGNIFTDSKSFVKYFKNIPIGIGNGDIYQAIIFATEIEFRAGVSKNFILIPCSECQGNKMVHDYSTIHEVLVENSISLHVLMNDVFNANKNKEKLQLFGIDISKAYTTKDVRNLTGDAELKRSISLPKSTLGFCFSLALERKGSIFSAKFLESNKDAKKFSKVFAKKIAQSAIQNECIDCECSARNTGISYMDCYPCTYHRAPLDSDLDENFFIR